MGAAPQRPRLGPLGPEEGVTLNYLTLHREYGSQMVGQFERIEDAREAARDFLKQRARWDEARIQSVLIWGDTSFAEEETLDASEPLYLDGVRDDDSHFYITSFKTADYCGM